MVWYSHCFQNFPQFIVIHIVKGFGIVNKAEIDISLEVSCFFHDLEDVGDLSLVPLIPYFYFVPPCLPVPFGKFVLYVSESISILYTDSFVLFLDSIYK